MKYIQQLIPLLRNGSLASAFVLLFAGILSFVRHDYEGVKHAGMLLALISILFALAQYCILEARKMTGGTTHKNNCPITVIKKTKQGKWQERLSQTDNARYAIRLYSVVYVIIVIVVLCFLCLLW